MQARRQIPAVPLKLKKPTGPMARRVLEHEVAVEQERGRARERRCLVVEMAPARLHHAHAGIVERRHHAAQEVARRHEVRVEDRDEVSPRLAEPVLERARLVSEAVAAPDHAHVDAGPPPGLGPRFRDEGRRVRRVVEDLHLEPIARPVELAGGVDEPPDDVALVEHGELHGHDRKIVRKRARRLERER
jgi:hypothetical protein